MTRALAVFLVTTFAAIAAIAGFDGLSLMLAQQTQVMDRASSSAAGSVHSFIEWLRVVGGIVGMVLGGVGVWVYYRTTVNKSTVAALNETVAAYKARIDAFVGQMAQANERANALIVEHQQMMLALAEKDAQIATLRERTDITAVLKLQNDLLSLKREHDTQMLQAIKAVTDNLTSTAEQSETRYGAILRHLTEQATHGVEQSTDNGKAIGKLITLASDLSKRMSRMEIKVDDVRDTMTPDTTPSDDRS